MDSKTLLLHTQEAIRKGATIADTAPGLAAIANSFKALLKLSEYMMEYDVSGSHYCPECGRKGISFEQAGKSAAYLSKVINDTVRLMEFHQGNADSRAEVTSPMTDMVQKLTSDQLATVLRWMDENEPRESPFHSA